MDRIEQLMKDAKPQVGVPDAAPGRGSAPSMVFSMDPNVVRMAARTPARRTGVRTAAATLVAAAAVVGAVIVGGNLMPESVPGPARTGSPAPADSASPSQSAPSAPLVPTASPDQAGTAGRALSTGGVECTMANVDQQRSDQVGAIKGIPAGEQAYYTVLGCAEGWLAYSISDDGIRALQLDGGNAWYLIAKLQDGRFLTDFRQEWSVVFTWEFQALNNQGLTPQQAMDQEFSKKGIPVELRPNLVGDGPGAG